VGDRRFTVVTDHLGAPSALVDEDGVEVWAAELGAYGQRRATSGDPAACPFRWPGQYEDAETGLHYNRFRYYDPEGGLYLSQDPIRLRGGARLYAYAPDPTTLIDPLGLVHEDEPGYSVYVLVDVASGDPYYVGISNDPERRGPEHIHDGRLSHDVNVSYMEPRIVDVTYGEARGAEQAMMEDLGTRKAGTFPGNVYNSISRERLDNPANARERTFKQHYDKYKRQEKPPESGC
jgi:RHS repeat-associated protein